MKKVALGKCMKMPIDKYVKSKPQRQRNFLFSCFVDFSKAFDSVPRNKLFDKLRAVVIKGHFLGVLMYMYSNNKSAVKIENKITQTFLCHNGVEQRFMLSPTLFNIYLSDLPEMLNIACNCKLDTDPEELVQKKFLKLLLGVNKYCNTNACRAETGRFPLRITAQCRTLKSWLTLSKHEDNNCHKFSQVAYNDIKRIKDEISWSQEIKNFSYHIGLGNLWGKNTFF